MDEDYSIGDVAKYLNKIRKKKKKGKPVENSNLSDLFGSSACSNNTIFYSRYLKDVQVKKKAEKKEKSKKGQKVKEGDSTKEKDEKNDTAQETETFLPGGDAEQHEEQEEGEEEKSQPDASKDHRTIFVGNVPKKVEKKTLEKVFQEYGSIESIRVRSLAPSQQGVPQQVVGKTKDINDRRTNYNAYIVFAKEESARKALEKNGEELDGHHLRVDLTVNDRKKVDSKLSIFVGSLPYDVREEDVRDHFEDFGILESVRLIRDPETGMGKGFGFIVFEDQSSVALALKMKEHILHGRRIRVKPVENVKKPKTPKSSHQNKQSSNPQRSLNPKTLKRIRHKKKLGMKKRGGGETGEKPSKKHKKFNSEQNNEAQSQSNKHFNRFDQKKKFAKTDKRSFGGKNQDSRRKEKTVKRKHGGNAPMKGIQAPAGKKIKFD